MKENRSKSDDQKNLVFISHAFKDKNSFTDEFVMELKKRGIKTWYSSAELKPGHSIYDSVNKGILQAQYGIAIISSEYLEQKWTMAELKTLFDKESLHQNIIIPILHGITIEEVRRKYPLLVDKYAISTDIGIPKVVDKILEVIESTESDLAYTKNKLDRKYFPKLKVLFRLIPLVILFSSLVYLGSLNANSEVSMSLIASKISFDIHNEQSPLIENISASSIQMWNCLLHLQPNKIFENDEEIEMSSNLPPVNFSEIIFHANLPLKLKALHITNNAKVKVVQEADYIFLTINTLKDIYENKSQDPLIRGIVSVPDTFTLLGNNVSHSDTIFSFAGNKKLKIIPNWNGKDLYFEANHKFEIILNIDSTQVFGINLLEDIYIENISFVERDETKQTHNEFSTIKEGSIGISGLSLYRKRFLLHEYSLKNGLFLDVYNNDQYELKSGKITRHGLEMSLFCDTANNLRTGERIEHLHSIFPSILDVIIGEPAKNTLYTIIIFLLTQFALFKKFIFGVPS